MLAPWIWIFLILPYARGNTEKTIFLGPSPIDLGSAHPTLRDLQLVALSPDEFTTRTYLDAEFPNTERMHGKSSWFILHQLNEGRRYEVRVCWAATQPTVFRLDTYDPATVLGAPELASELSAYASSRRDYMDNYDATSSRNADLDIEDAVLLLRIAAAADFYTTNQTLMTSIPPVFVDIILDPFILNVFPRSLSYTVTYILAVTILSWLVGEWISSRVCVIAAEPTKQKYH
ncbi:hypothetical protein F4777DRAFT_478647 [Nemania sp. FL0916]|nr:hypothetical protein F4777DRAFT_478647 [Nemania sp. FL0916]